MYRQKNTEIAQQLLAGMGAGKDPDTLAAMFSERRPWTKQHERELKEQLLQQVAGEKKSRAL
jgi:hypothetical protein